MPLPVFPKSRKWKSCNAITPGPLRLPYQNGINKARTLMRHKDNTSRLTKRALKKEMNGHWQKLVLMSQAKKCTIDGLESETTEKSKDLTHLDTTQEKLVPEMKENRICNNINHKTENFWYE